MNLPFQDYDRARHFSKDVEPSELQWHTDEEDRYITALHDNDWLFQSDNEQPQRMKPAKTIFIQRGVWHRLIKGTTDLKLYILKITP